MLIQAPKVHLLSNVFGEAVPPTPRLELPYD